MSKPLRVLLAIGAIIELSVGLAALTSPEWLIWLLFDAVLPAAGIPIARLLGAALIALGLAWWFAQKKPREASAKGSRFGFLVYNLGAAIVLMETALSATERVVLLWALGVFHMALGFVFAAIIWAGKRGANRLRRAQVE